MKINFRKKLPWFLFVLPFFRFLKTQNLKVRNKFSIFAQSKCAEISTNKVMICKMTGRSLCTLILAFALFPESFVLVDGPVPSTQ